MNQDAMNVDVRQLSGKRKGQGAKPTNEGLSAAEEQEPIAGMIRQSGDTRDETETETGKFISTLTPHQVVEKLISVRTTLEADLEHHAQSGRIFGYAAADSVCREDPW